MNSGRLALLKEDIERTMLKLDACTDAAEKRNLLISLRHLIAEIDHFLASEEGFDR
jgi:hypothetical protein